MTATRRVSQLLFTTVLTIAALPGGVSSGRAQEAPPEACGEVLTIPEVNGYPALGSLRVVNDHGLAGGTSFYAVAALWDSRRAELTVIGALSGETGQAGNYRFYSSVEGLNARGEAVGTSIKTDRTYAGFYWSRATGLREIEGSSDAHAINDRGLVVGSGVIEGITRPITWSRDDGLEALDLLPGCASGSAIDVNEGGVILGHLWCAREGQEPPGEQRTVVWYPHSGPYDLGTFRGLRPVGIALDALGRVTASATDAEGAVHALRWHPFTGFVEVAVFPAGVRIGGTNDAGTLVGGYAVPGTNFSRSFRYTRSEGFRDLGIDLGQFSGGAADINRSGLIVGSYGPNSRSTGGYVWKPCR